MDQEITCRLLPQPSASERWAVDAQMRLLSHSGERNIFSDLAPDELIGRSLEGLIDPTLLNAQKAALAGRATSLELTQGGATYLITLSPCRKASGEIAGCEGVALDMSAYKTAARHIATLQRHAESILNAAGEGIYGLNLEGEATFVNPAAQRMTGWSAEETIGRNIHYMHHHSHADGSPYPHQECPIYAAIKDGEVHHVDDELFWRRDGTSFPVEYTSTPIYEGGQLAGAVVVFKDTTERKRVQQELMAAFREVARLKEQLQEENSYLQEEIRENSNFGSIIGTSQVVRAMLQKIDQVAPTDATVLIQGESGTGKGLIAHAIHENSRRRNKALVKVNCGAIPTGLVESELFGHEKGAFTGAHERRKGRFELADGGTLFLDEVSELPLDTQVKLLRILQEQEFERVGSGETIKVDVRIIAATNRNLLKEVADGKFRQDLYYRLNVFPIDVPPLRMRLEDIPLLARHFMELTARKLGKPLRGFSPQSMAALQAYRWPGNIRELQNVIERASILAEGAYLDVTGLLPIATEELTAYTQLASLEHIERAHIQRVLTHTHGVISGPKGAAVILGLHPNTLRSRMLKLGIHPTN